MKNKPTKRQVQIVEDFVKKTTKSMLKEGSTQQTYSKILELYRQATEYSQPTAQVRALTKSLAEFFTKKFESM